MSKIKLLKGLASLFKKKGSKKKEMFGPARDPEVDYESINKAPRRLDGRKQ